MYKPRFAARTTNPITIRVQNWEQVASDEVATVKIEPRLRAKFVLERCQWTDAAGKLDIGRPDDGGQMHPHRTAPFQASNAPAATKSTKDK